MSRDHEGEEQEDEGHGQTSLRRDGVPQGADVGHGSVLVVFLQADVHVDRPVVPLPVVVVDSAVGAAEARPPEVRGLGEPVATVDPPALLVVEVLGRDFGVLD